MAEGERGIQKLVSKSQNKLPIRSTNMASGLDSEYEYMEDELYANFRVSEMFSDECDEYYEESVRRVEGRFRNESEDHDDYEYDNVVVDSPGNSMVGTLKQYLAAASDQIVESSTGAGGGEPTFRFSRRLFDDDDDDSRDVVTKCLSPGKHGKDLRGMSPAADDAEFLKTLGDCLEPSPSLPSSTLRATGGPDDMQRYTRSEGDVNPGVRGTVYGGPDDVQRYTRSEGSIHPRNTAHKTPDFRAVIQRDEIVLIAKELMALGNDISKQYEERMRSLEGKESLYLVYWRKLASCIRTVTDAIDATLTWVEHHSKAMMENVKNLKDMQKQEGVLRGLVLLTDVSQRVNSIAVIQMACQYLDARNEPFEAQRDAVRKSLDQVGSEIENISETVKKASELLNQIIEQCNNEKNNPEVRKLTLHFDNAVLDAHLAIRLCENHLENANKNVKSLLFKINSVRWFHRGLRCAGFGLTAYYFYGKYCDGSINKSTAYLASGFSLIAWLAMFPTKTYEYYEQLSELQFKHEAMRQQLMSLRLKLHSVYGRVHGQKKVEKSVGHPPIAGI